MTNATLTLQREGLVAIAEGIKSMESMEGAEAEIEVVAPRSVHVPLRVFSCGGAELRDLFGRAM